MFFASDNAAGAAPEILEAVTAAADGFAPAYGADPITVEVEALVREIFEAPEARVFLVATGTAANALALATLCPPWATVYCHPEAHVEVDECAAPEFFTGGAKLTLLSGADAKLSAAALAEAARNAAPVGVHNVQNGAVSITQATERGAIYTAAETAEIGRIAKDHGMGLHLDGTRFANAVARGNASPADLSWKAGVDILCLGATKNGALAAEAIVVFDPAQAREIEFRRKRGGHLFSKMRFVAAQMRAYLTDGLWLRLAGHANAMADRLATGLAAAGGRALHPVGANMVFAEITRAQHARLQAAGARYYPWPGHQAAQGPADAPFSIRLVCTHQTDPADVDRFLEVLAA